MGIANFGEKPSRNRPGWYQRSRISGSVGFKNRKTVRRGNDRLGAKRSPSMSLGDLVSLLNAELLGVEDEALAGVQSTVITGVQEDSRQITTDNLFVATRGMTVDGHNYAEAARALGAAAIVVERRLEVALPQLLVEDASHSLGILAAHAAGNPADGMSTIGITGTNGKTTTTYLVEAMVEAAERVPGVLGTVSYRWGGQEIAAPYTTPTPLVLQSAFTSMAEHGCDTSILEVSSAALHMDRLVGTQFDVAAFSNLSQDHLDIHETMEEYRDAKARLFRDNLKPDGVAVINIDDSASAAMMEAAGDRAILRVSRRLDCQAEIRVIAYSSTIEGIEAEIATPRGTLTIQTAGLIGHYNVDNIALAVGIGEALQLPMAAIADGIAQMTGVPGRVERVPNAQGINIFVDYAHTPDALVNVLSALRPLTRSRLLCVFGCGGDRDPGKRPLMGTAVAENADLAVVTSDNPRTEDPQSIVDMITPAVPKAFFVDTDRRIAIRAAIAEATPNDVVLIAGKGHEDYQILGTEKVHFDDREEAAAACLERETFELETLLACTAGELVSESDTEFDRVIIDGRSAAPGDLYVAIIGERFDGHDYCQQAIDAGATGLVVARGRGVDLEGVTIIETDDPRAALGEIAKMHRQRWQGRAVIGITGSAGKTTTKELIAAALAGTGRVHAAKGSNNNETGVPLTLLGLRPFHDFAVIEMGMRGLGEIDYLTKLAQPTVAAVVNAGTAHIGRLGSLAAIAQAKGEIYGHLENGTAVFPSDNESLANLAQAANCLLSFGDATENSDNKADVLLTAYEPAGAEGSRLQILFEGATHELTLPLVGKHNAINACCAIATAIAATASPTSAITGIQNVQAPAMRSEVREIAGRKVLMDCYNANPDSVDAALKTLMDLSSGHRAVAVLGDMLELGEQAVESHKRVGEQAAALKIPVLAMGEHRRSIVAGAAGLGGIAWSAADVRAAARAALACTQAGDWILLKASRGMKLERVAESIQSEARGL